LRIVRRIPICDGPFDGGTTAKQDRHGMTAQGGGTLVTEGKAHCSNGPVFSVAPMIDWTDAG
jgi:hypothetical protein